MKDKIFLFGNRPYCKIDEKETEGLFPEDVVLKVMEQCIFRKRETKRV